MAKTRNVTTQAWKKSKISTFQALKKMVLIVSLKQKWGGLNSRTFLILTDPKSITKTVLDYILPIFLFITGPGYCSSKVNRVGFKLHSELSTLTIYRSSYTVNTLTSFITQWGTIRTKNIPFSVPRLCYE